MVAPNSSQRNWKRAYKDRLIQGAWQHHILENSDFTSKREKEIVCDLYLDAYRAGMVSLKGKRGLLKTLLNLLGSDDDALFGRVVREATKQESEKKDGPSTIPGLKRRVRLLLEFMKIKYPGLRKAGREQRLINIFRGWNIEFILPRVGGFDEFFRNRDRRNRRTAKRPRQ